MMKDLCRDVVREGGYDVDPDVAARGLAAMTEGLWLDMLLSPRSMPREQARHICMTYLRNLFPRHFSGQPKKGKAK